MVGHILGPLGAHKVPGIEGIVSGVGDQGGSQSNAQRSSRATWQADEHRSHGRQVVAGRFDGHQHDVGALAPIGVMMVVVHHHGMRVAGSLLLQEQRLAGALSHGAGRRGGGGGGVRMWTVCIQAARRQEDLGERALGQMQHLHDMLPPSPSQVRRLLHLPHDHADGEEEEKAGEEH